MKTTSTAPVRVTGAPALSLERKFRRVEFCSAVSDLMIATANHLPAQHVALAMNRIFGLGITTAQVQYHLRRAKAYTPDFYRGARLQSADLAKLRSWYTRLQDNSRFSAKREKAESAVA